MKGFLAQWVAKYVELAKFDPKKINKVDTPFVEVPREGITSDGPKFGALQPIAGRVLMTILYAARMGRFDLLKPTRDCIAHYQVVGGMRQISPQFCLLHQLHT